MKRVRREKNYIGIQMNPRRKVDFNRLGLGVAGLVELEMSRGGTNYYNFDIMIPRIDIRNWYQFSLQLTRTMLNLCKRHFHGDLRPQYITEKSGQFLLIDNLHGDLAYR